MTRLLSLVSQAEGDIEKLRTSIEQWYDDHMARVSGWYKRHVRWISLGLALLFAAFFNLNAIEIGRTLYSDEAVRAQVVEQAQGSTACTGRRRQGLPRGDPQGGERRHPDRMGHRGGLRGRGRDLRVVREGQLRPRRRRRAGDHLGAPHAPVRHRADGRSHDPGRPVLVRLALQAGQPEVDRAEAAVLDVGLGGLGHPQTIGGIGSYGGRSDGRGNPASRSRSTNPLRIRCGWSPTCFWSTIRPVR